MKLVLALAVCAVGCVPKTIFNGHTPDRRHAFAIQRQGDLQWVVVDGKRRAAYRSIAAWSIASTSEGRIAYAAMRGKHWVVAGDVRRGDDKSGNWSGIGEIVLAGPRTAFSAERAGRWHVVIDGAPSPPWDAILAGTLQFSGDGKHHAYVARDATGTRVVVDGIAGEAWGGIGQLQLSPDGHVTYAARRGEAAHVVADGVTSPAYEAVEKLTLVGARPVFAARDARGWRVIDGEQRSEPFTAIRSLAVRDGHVAYVARADDVDIVACDGRTLARSAPIVIDSLVLVRDCEVAYVVRDARGDRLIRGASERAYDEVGRLVVAGAKLAYAARRGDQWQVVIDDRELAGGAWISDPVLSRDGSRVAYLARRGKQWLAIVDGRLHSFDLILDGTLAFSRDGRRWAVIAGDLRREQLFIAVDGTRRVPLAVSELYSAAAQRSLRPLLAESDEGEVLRAWSAAEADKPPGAGP